MRLYEPKPGEELRSGRCHRCWTIWQWPARTKYPVRVRDAYCHQCGEKLRPTAAALIKNRSVAFRTVEEPANETRAEQIRRGER